MEKIFELLVIAIVKLIKIWNNFNNNAIKSEYDVQTKNKKLGV